MERFNALVDFSATIISSTMNKLPSAHERYFWDLAAAMNACFAFFHCFKLIAQNPSIREALLRVSSIKALPECTRRIGGFQWGIDIHRYRSARFSIHWLPEV